jgi:hypothetical protein
MQNQILIIPDIHEKIHLADHIVSQFPNVSKRIWLGDYLDSFEYENRPDHWTAVCEWLDRTAQDPANILLAGNHDVHYFCDIAAYKCSGYFTEKHQIVKQVLGHQWVNKLKWVHTETVNGELTLFSHAGLNPWLISPHSVLNTQYFDNLNVHIHSKLQAGIEDSLLSAGRGRGGRGRIGGVTWQDWRTEFESIPDVRQVVGHSETQVPRWKGYNLCIDTQLTHVALFDTETNIVSPQLVDLSGFDNPLRARCSLYPMSVLKSLCCSILDAQ